MIAGGVIQLYFAAFFFSVQMWKVSHLLFSTSMSNKGREKFQEKRMRLKESVGSEMELA